MNLTTGTWPSPFWTYARRQYRRGGEDDSIAGVGLTASAGSPIAMPIPTAGRANGPPLPAKFTNAPRSHLRATSSRSRQGSGYDFRNEIRSYFGTGTQSQEMYITALAPDSSRTGTTLAEAAKWSRTNAYVLKDTHWVGGYPAWLGSTDGQSWTPKKGILVLRNPSDL